MGGGVEVWTTDMGPQKMPFHWAISWIPVYHIGHAMFFIKGNEVHIKDVFFFIVKLHIYSFFMFFNSRCVPLFPQRANKNSIRMIISIYVQCLNLKHLSLSLYPTLSKCFLLYFSEEQCFLKVANKTLLS